MSEAAAKAFITDPAGSTSAQDVRDAIGVIYADMAFSGAKVTKSANQTNIGTGSVKVTWDQTVFDTDSYFDNANDRLIAPQDGIYRITAAISGPEAGSGNRSLTVAVNGTALTDLGRDNAGAASEWIRAGSVLLALDATDFVEIFVTSSAAGMDVRGDFMGFESSWFSIERVGV